MPFDNAYEALAAADEDGRWAFGTGFTDPLSGLDPTVPNGVDRADLAMYCLMLGDDALIMSHRLQQWCTRAPELEEEMALANIALDLLGQARWLLSRAGMVEGLGRDEDALAFGRDASEFRNLTLVESEDPDFAHLIVRLLAFSCWRLALLAELTLSRDPVLAAVAGKGAIEIRYHRDHAARWAVRLGDGTALSRQRMAAALDRVLPDLGEAFAAHPVELRSADAGVGVDPRSLRSDVEAALSQVLTAATLPGALHGSLPAGSVAPEGMTAPQPWGRDGRHTGAMTDVLAELQGVARAVPGGIW